MAWTKRNVGSLVKKYLQRHQPQSQKFKLNVAGVNQAGGYWYVLVEPNARKVRYSEYGEELLDTEEDIRDHEKDAPNLLLVPVLPTDPDDR
jgi:hypothetical protein